MKDETIVLRGVKPKYDFNVNVGEVRQYQGTSASVLINCAKSYCYRRGLDWQFHCFTVDGVVSIVRIK